MTGFNPRYASRNPTALLEKRMEDLIRIVKSQERDIFKPILERTAGLAGGIHESPDYARMMNEMRDLQERTGSSDSRLRTSDRLPLWMWRRNGKGSAGWSTW